MEDDTKSDSSAIAVIRGARERANLGGDVEGGSGGKVDGGGGGISTSASVPAVEGSTLGAEGNCSVEAPVVAFIRKAFKTSERKAVHSIHLHEIEPVHTSKERWIISPLASERSCVRFEIAFISSVPTIGHDKRSEVRPVGLFRLSKCVPPSCGRSQISRCVEAISSGHNKVSGDSVFHSSMSAKSQAAMSVEFLILLGQCVWDPKEKRKSLKETV